ncbi:hypothetical protein ACFQXB_04255 [Plastorhodobacter daqingensis]|uniref:Uncharacterized protein n=1 Tax=Plastorhodobacter daqingensis TaxID=1387281 RepID=A0ABW2UIJ3_9RHOB
MDGMIVFGMDPEFSRFGYVECARMAVVFPRCPGTTGSKTCPRFLAEAPSRGFWRPVAQNPFLLGISDQESTVRSNEARDGAFVFPVDQWGPSARLPEVIHAHRQMSIGMGKGCFVASWLDRCSA